MGDVIDRNVRRGEVLHEQQVFTLACPGVVRGKVKYVASNGPGSAGPVEEGQKTLTVGRFSFDVP